MWTGQLFRKSVDNPNYTFAVRLPTVSEIEVEAEVGFIFKQSPEIYGSLNDETQLSFATNFFKPSAFESAIFSSPRQPGFESCCTSAAYPATQRKPATIADALEAHDKFKLAVKHSLRRKK